ncbi:hypothetical protein HWV62_37213, partial [Athelia sp. TMB]
MKEARHPNVVLYLGLSRAPDPDGRIFIISEFIDNGNLRVYIHDKQKPFPWRLRLSFAIDIARALAYLHARKCIHRDLKGENLLVTSNGRLKITDFGFARIAARNEDESKRLTFCGTDSYMSPEIQLGDEFDLPTDIFSFGVILCEIAARKLADDYTFKRAAPTFGMDAQEVRNRASPGCPDAFIQLCLDCLAVEPADRPTTLVILDRLNKIEADVLAQSPEKDDLHVGSVKFMTAGRRPTAPRIPSFGMGVGPPIPTPTSEEENTSSDDELIEAVLGLNEVQLGSDMSHGASNGHDVLSSGISGDPLLQRPSSSSSFSEYSTTVIRTHTPQPAPPTLSSVLTVRPAPSTDPAQAAAMTEPTEPVTSHPSLSEMYNKGSLISIESYRTATSSIAPSTALATEGGSTIRQAPMVHRFTLLRPGAKRPTVASSAANGSASPPKTVEQGWNPLDIFFSSGLLVAKCDICMKRIGWKPVLECDDCGLRSSSYLISYTNSMAYPFSCSGLTSNVEKWLQWTAEVAFKRGEVAPPVVVNPTPTPTAPLSLDALISALNPPAVPSLGHARSLASMLSLVQSPLPKPAVLNPILAALCGEQAPPALQVAGFDIITAYWESSGATDLGTADRLSYFSLFLGPVPAWSYELWEARFRALRALSSSGAEIIGTEAPLLDLLKIWVDGAYQGLLSPDLLDPVERADRERIIEQLTQSITTVVENMEIVARIPEHELVGVLLFYGEMVERALDLPSDFTTPGISSPTSATDVSATASPTRHHSHRRHPSSLTLPSLSSQSTIAPPTAPAFKHPMDIAINIYINHLTSQLKILAPGYIALIMPLLFRALAFYASPLPRLSITEKTPESSPIEDRITDTLTPLLAGPFSTSCIGILKRYLFPPHALDDAESLIACTQTSLGAHRTFRTHVRRRLYSRMARAFINRESSSAYNHTGSPSHMNMDQTLMERAWPKDDIHGWEADRLGRTISSAVEAWITWNSPNPSEGDELISGKEKILDEAAGTLKDIFQELDMRDDDSVLDEESACAVGETLYQLATYVLDIKNADGTTFIIPLAQPTDAPTPFLRTLTSLLARDHTTYLSPLLSTILLCVANNLSDADTAKLPTVMFEQHDLSPTSPEWLSNWKNLLGNSGLLSSSRPLTRSAIMNALEAVYESVNDMPSYRMPLANEIFQCCQRQAGSKEDSEGDVMWRILGEEVVLRTVEDQGGVNAAPAGDTVDELLTLLITVAAGQDDDDDDDDTISVHADISPSSQPHSAFPYSSPLLSRMQTEYASKDRDSNLPSVMAILSSIATGNSSRSQSQQPPAPEDPGPEPSIAPPSESSTLPRSVGAVIALISLFCQLAFTPHASKKQNLDVAARIYDVFVNLMTGAKSVKARLAVLQFMMRTRADRDHRMYFVDALYDPDGRSYALASNVERVAGSKESVRSLPEEPTGDSDFLRKARARLPQERDGRGRGKVSTSASSRSRSRVPTQPVTRVITPAVKHHKPLWFIPESLPFAVAEVDTPSDGLLSYDPTREEHEHVLQLSDYLTALITLIEKEKSWEILSYVLCHLPVQLSNKHLFCGPKCRELMARLLRTLCTGLISTSLASEIDYWPPGLKARDAQGLAYHTVSVLISYKRCFDIRQQHLLVEVLQAGLNNGQFNTISCCLHGLSLAAFELQSSMRKCLSRVLENLSQIMSNPELAVHIISFLSIVGSLRELHSNFTEDDYKMVFGVALQYLQHYNRLGSATTISWALSQHLRVLAYHTVYVWFLSLRLPDRPRHIPYITRQLLLANEGRDTVDEPTEVCFDWLARYTYASADPRPSNSLFSEIVMNPTTPGKLEVAVTEKTWLVGNSVVTIRALSRLGWIEILSRRPSGYTKFLCRVENVPMVAVGDPDPDTMSVPASLLMDRENAQVAAPAQPETAGDVTPQAAPMDTASQVTPHNLASFRMLTDGIRQDVAKIVLQDNGAEGHSSARPDPLTGYVWSGQAPSQRRKRVNIDPSFFALHLSAYPKSSPEDR